MKCIEAQRMVQPYLEKRLSDRELEHFLDHVESCPECFDELEIYFSIYSTLSIAGTKEEPEEYNFKKKLYQSIKADRRYLRLRKTYRVFRCAVVLIAEFLLIMTLITGMEMLGEEGSRGTTIYRVIYGGRNTLPGINAPAETEPTGKEAVPAADIEAAGKKTEPAADTEAAGKKTVPAADTEAAGKKTEPAADTEAAGKKTVPAAGAEAAAKQAVATAGTEAMAKKTEPAAGTEGAEK